jgi:hypothetical protein
VPFVITDGINSQIVKSQRTFEDASRERCDGTEIPVKPIRICFTAWAQAKDAYRKRTNAKIEYRRGVTTFARADVGSFVLVDEEKVD